MARIAKRGWLERLGLRAADPDPDDWVIVATAPVDSQVRSSRGEKMVTMLTEAGIEARSEPYVRPDDSPDRGRMGGTGSNTRDRVRVAVLVRLRDRAQADELVGGGRVEPVSDEELARLAEQAGPPPPE